MPATTSDKRFNIPNFLLDFWNKVMRRELSVYSRREQPYNLHVDWGDFTYRGVGVKRPVRMVLTYDSYLPSEIYNVTYTDDGDVEEIRKITQTLSEQA